MNLRLTFRFPPTLSANLKTNFIAFLWDIGWWGVYIGSTLAFLTIYASRSGATPEQIGLLTAAPATLSLVLSLPVGRYLRRVSASQATLLSATVGRMLFLVYAILPWILPQEMQVGGLLALAILLALPNTVINISFSQFFIESVPSDWRGTIVGLRMAIMSIISFIVTLVCGQILSHMSFPAGYQLVFFIGFIGGIMTVFQIARVKPVPNPAIHSPSPFTNYQKTWLPVLDSPARTYLKVISLLFVFNLTNNMFAPLVPDLLVHKLKLTDVTISIGTAVSNFLVFTISLLIARITHRIGNRSTTAIGIILLTFHAISLALAKDALLFMAAAVIGGIASGLLSAAQYNYHLDNLPSSERSTWLSWNLLLGNTAVLLGSLAGPALARFAGTEVTLFIFAASRLLIGMVIFVKG
jgi:MFS family permease